MQKRTNKENNKAQDRLINQEMNLYLYINLLKANKKLHLISSIQFVIFINFALPQ